MARYLRHRVLAFAGGLLLVVVISFVAIYWLPGDPARMILGPRATTESIQQFRKDAGLDESLPRQFGRFAVRVARLDLGESLMFRRPVTEVIAGRAATTAALVGAAVAILLTFAILCPVALQVAGLGVLDHGLRAVWTGLSVSPPYVLALLTLTLFAGKLQILPAVFEPDRLRCWIAAAFVLAAYPTALVSRLFRDALAVAMASDYATQARAQGFRESAILLRDAAPNALMAPVSALANGLAYFFTGTFFVEVAFGVGGIGSLTYEAIRNKDMAILAGICLVFAALISAVSTGLDVAQHLVDPRLRRARV
jgi:ABC-type dipeptide/oligopeptide/nickel transport system permease component